MTERTAINVFGPSTAGKSTVAELLKKEIDRVYTVDFDVVKRQISGYFWKRDSQVAKELTFETLSAVTKTGLQLLILFPPPSQEEYERLRGICEKSGYRFLNVEVTAPEVVLMERYMDRIRRVEANGSKYRIKTLEEFKEALSKPYFKPSVRLTFDSSKMSPEEICRAVLDAARHSA